MHHDFLHNDAWWRVVCLPGYHRIEGRGLVLATPLVRQERHLFRCCADRDAQYFLRWDEQRVADVLGPDPWRVRLNPLPRPWSHGFMNFAIRRMGSREIIGTAWIEPFGDTVELSASMRADQRRNSIGGDAATAMAALFSQHFGSRRMFSRTASVNRGANRALETIGARLIEAEVPRVTDSGLEYLENVWDLSIGDPSRRCRWGHEFGRRGAPDESG